LQAPALDLRLLGSELLHALVELTARHTADDRLDELVNNAVDLCKLAPVAFNGGIPPERSRFMCFAYSSANKSHRTGSNPLSLQPV
jgi:hypothetical protein